MRQKLAGINGCSSLVYARDLARALLRVTGAAKALVRVSVWHGDTQQALAFNGDGEHDLGDAHWVRVEEAPASAIIYILGH